MEAPLLDQIHRGRQGDNCSQKSYVTATLPIPDTGFLLQLCQLTVSLTL